MNLRNLFNSTRFAGCVNGRFHVAPFLQAEDALPLAVFCQERPDGSAALMLAAEGRVTNPLSLPLPDVLRGRIDFWNKWASRALEYEYEITPSLYGLEAYGISVAMELAALYPTHRVTYGGLPINAEHTLPDYLKSFNTWEQRLSHTPPPPTYERNRYMQRLLASTEPVTECENAHIFDGWVEPLANQAHFYFETYTEGNYGPFHITESEGFPAWLEKRMRDMEFIHAWEYADTLLTPFWQDAMSVDITRFIRPLLPVAFTQRYITGEDVLAVCRNT